MKLTAKEREAIEKAVRWANSPASTQGWDVTAHVTDAHTGYDMETQLMICGYALGYIAGQRDAKKGKGKK